MGKYEEFKQQLFDEFLRLCEEIDQCNKILAQKQPTPVIKSLDSNEQMNEYVRKVAIAAAKKKDVVWDTHQLLSQLHGYASNVPEAIVKARGALLPVLTNVASVLDDFTIAQGRLEAWEGNGAKSVGDRLTELKTFVDDQTAYVTYLDAVLEQYELLVRTGEDNSEKLAAAVTEALTKGEHDAKTAKVEFVLQLFEGAEGLAGAVKSKNPLDVIRGVQAIVGSIKDYKAVMEASDPDRIMGAFRAEVTKARTNLAEAGDRLAKHFTHLLEEMKTQNTKKFFKDGKVILDVTSPNFNPADFKLKGAENWEQFSREVKKLPKAAEGSGELGSIGRRLETDRAPIPK